jgi:hypothetical protein
MIGRFPSRLNCGKLFANIILAKTMTTKSRDILEARFKNELVRASPPGRKF